MTVVDRVQHQVLVVPAERRVLHAHVQPRDVNAADVVDARELHQRVKLLRQVVQVPGMVHVMVLPLVDHFLVRSAEARAKLARRHISSVLNPRALTLTIVH